jgi:hypothetical protein
MLLIWPEAVMLRYFECKFFTSAFAYGLVSCFLGACSIHPIPKDVTGYGTATIVRKIRCEARDAIRKVVLEILHRDGRHNEIQEITDEFSWRQMPLNSWEQKKLNDVQEIGIVYDFSLQGDETDNLTFNATILDPFKSGMATFAPSLGNQTERNNVRAFTVTDSFASLWNLGRGKGDKDHCYFGSSASSGPNFEYPIAGRIGLDEMVQTFVRLSVAGDLVANEDLSGPFSISPSGAPTMVDTLIFTTTVNAGLEPSVTLTPGTGVQLTNASLNGTVKRVDVHEVVIAMAVGKSTVHLSAAALAASLTPRTTSLFFTSNPKNPGSSGEALAAQAATQYYIRRSLLRRASIAIAAP